MPEMWVPSLGREDSLEVAWQPTPVFLPEKSHGHRGLEGYRSVSKKLHMTERACMHTHTSPSSIPFSTHFYKTIRQNPCSFHKHILLTRYERELPKLTSWLTGVTTVPKLEMFGLRV